MLLSFVHSVGDGADPSPFGLSMPHIAAEAGGISLEDRSVG
jgi:hypothetical protein